MTLDETIKRFTSNAFYEKSDGNLQGYLEFNQLAEWLKELKELRKMRQLIKRKIDILEDLASIENNEGRWRESEKYYHAKGVLEAIMEGEGE